MRLMLTLLAVATLAGAALAEPVGDCDSKGQPALGIVDTHVGFYVDDRNYVMGNGIWVYQESNGMAGLQRGGYSCAYCADNEICYDTESDINGPDTLIF